VTDATDNRAAIERMAVASPGQTVFLRAKERLTHDMFLRIQKQLDQLNAETGVKVVLLDQNLEVARIKDDG
jgi:hypothetical protein